MISEKLKLLALCGRASWYVHNGGMAETLTIPCPKNGFLILEQIIWNPYINSGDQATANSALAGCQHTMSIVEQGGADEIFYNLRTPVALAVTPDGKTFVATPAQSPIIIPTFKVFRKNINIDLIKLPQTQACTTVVGAIDAEGQERPNRSGYQGDSIIGEVVPPGIGSQHFFPNAPERKQAGVAVVGKNLQMWRAQAGNTTKLIRPDFITTANSEFSEPLFGLGFWKVNGTPEDLYKFLQEL